MTLNGQSDLKQHTVKGLWGKRADNLNEQAFLRQEMTLLRADYLKAQTALPSDNQMRAQLETALRPSSRSQVTAAAEKKSGAAVEAAAQQNVAAPTCNADTPNTLEQELKKLKETLHLLMK